MCVVALAYLLGQHELKTNPLIEHQRDTQAVRYVCDRETALQQEGWQVVQIPKSPRFYRDHRYHCTLQTNKGYRIQTREDEQKTILFLHPHDKRRFDRIMSEYTEQHGEEATTEYKTWTLMKLTSFRQFKTPNSDVHAVMIDGIKMLTYESEVLKGNWQYPIRSASPVITDSHTYDQIAKRVQQKGTCSPFPSTIEDVIQKMELK